MIINFIGNIPKIKKLAFFFLINIKQYKKNVLLFYECVCARILDSQTHTHTHTCKKYCHGAPCNEGTLIIGVPNQKYMSCVCDPSKCDICVTVNLLATFINIVCKFLKSERKCG